MIQDHEASLETILLSGMENLKEPWYPKKTAFGTAITPGSRFARIQLLSERSRSHLESKSEKGRKGVRQKRRSSILEIPQTPNFACEFLQRSTRFSCSVLSFFTKKLALAFKKVVDEIT